MTKAKVETDTDVKSDVKQDPKYLVNLQLDGSKNKYESVIILGYTPDGKLGIDTTNPNYGFLHAAFNEAVMELVLHRRDSLMKMPEPEVLEPEVKV